MNQFLKALIPNENYFEKSSFEDEETKIFQSTWSYIGLTSSLEANDDFITQEIGGKSIVIQNIKGEIKAFHNVCTHRFNKLKTEKQGNGSLTCPYHGWSYNKDGIPFGIPLKKEFQGLDKESLKTLCLPEFRLDVCGKFVFVNVSNGSLSLDDFLGNTAIKLKEISGMIGKKAEYHEIVNKANWKILVENTLEGYHISNVHPKTFYKQGFNLKSEVDFEIEGLHSNMLLHLAESHKEDKKREKFHKLLKNRPYQPDGFFHQLIFPNLSIGSLFGITVYIGSIKSISPNESVFAYELYETNLGEGESLSEAISEVVNFSSIEFTRTTLAEDREICENVQLGMEQSNASKGVLNSSEIRIWEFQKAYMDLINKQLINK
jgi:phenylpropionate dioxygenase-like ring-hydroxylating dioxygenase large terminal subunit